jgi:hypothetical protein
MCISAKTMGLNHIYCKRISGQNANQIISEPHDVHASFFPSELFRQAREKKSNILRVAEHLLAFSGSFSSHHQL